MKRCSLILVATLAGCSPTWPSPMDVQVAVELYYLEHVAQPDFGGIISCAPIAQLALDGREQKYFHVRFRFQASAGRPGSGGPVYSAAMRQGGRGWYIPRETRLDHLPCTATEVRELSGSPQDRG